MRNLLLSTVTLLVVPAVAIAAPDFPSHTHTTPIELKPISPSSGLKLASVCFLGYGECDDVGFGSGDEDYSVDTTKQCINEGYSKQNCNSVQEIDGVCPYNPAYGRGCKCVSNLISCPSGQVGNGDGCEGKYASCKCDPNLISCPSNKNGSGASCGGKYQSCVCKAEYQYTSSNCTSPRSVSGSSCDGKYTGCSCPSGVSSGSYGCEEYYPSPCSTVCKKAYTDNCRNRTAVSTPYGCAEYWSDCSSKCKTAYNDNCRNRIAVSAPYGCQKYYADCQSKCEIAKTQIACNLGDVFYADYTCVPSSQYNPSKTVLGFVVYVNPNGFGGQVMAPWPIDRNGNKLNDNSVTMPWGIYGENVTPLTDYTSFASAASDYDSCGNTDKLIAAGSADDYPAAWATRKYAPTSDTKGKWCLPAAGVISNFGSNRDLFDALIDKLGGVAYVDNWVWTSTEYNHERAWINSNVSYELNHLSKSISRYIRPVLEF